MSAETFDNRYRSAWCGLVRREQVGEQLRVAGWVHRRRDHGGLIFIDLRDREGLLQLVFHPDTAPEAHEAAHRLRSEDVLTVSGTLVERGEGTVNPELPTGEVELQVGSFELLADAQTSGGLLVVGELPGHPVVGEVVPRGEHLLSVR